jgi:hypothetical protein
MDAAVLMVRIAAMEVAPESERDLAVAGVVGRIQHNSRKGWKWHSMRLR